MALLQGPEHSLSHDLDRDARRLGEFDPPAIRAIDELHHRCIASSASDLHLEPTLDGGRVRARVDGTLCELREVPSGLFTQMVSRIKLLAGMDIADRRQPQDGRYQINHHHGAIDARVSSMPTVLGEKLVVRLLDVQARTPHLNELGMPSRLLDQYRALVRAPHGLLVVCGPTGSGKTTTLYASLAARDGVTEHLCSIEDPVEARIANVVQVQVNARAGLTFPVAFRSFLRQDPDVIMVGEMRDHETATVAMSASLCGQLVMTSLHSSDAPRAVERLTELGVSRHAMAAGLTGVIAQRLVRRLCEDCKVQRALQATDAERLELSDRNVDAAFEARGCPACGLSGYRQRLALFEGFSISREIRASIAAGGSSLDIERIAVSEGFTPMRMQALDLVAAGQTSIEEVGRVLAL